VNLSIWIAIGAIIGGLVGLLSRGLQWRSTLVDAAVGVAGAVSLGWFLLPMSASADPNNVSVSGLVGAFVGAAALVALSEIIRP
jgi:uncharacterized membrane protein YeaQ/YmgE (transglycosylase-associated protein family)